MRDEFPDMPGEDDQPGQREVLHLSEVKMGTRM